MKFFCITPCFNAQDYIEKTIQSVINQTALRDPANELTYVICNNNSTDATASIIEKYKKIIEKIENIKLIHLNQKDNGMYDAIAKALKSETKNHDIYSYINCGDFYADHAFDIVSEIISKNNFVHWITGINTWYNEKSHIIKFNVPFSYKRDLIKAGAYGRNLPYIQQESTFWDNHLNKTINLKTLSTYKYAGDNYLWHVFANHCDLYIVNAWLSGFKIHSGQLSEIHMNKYKEESGYHQENLNLTKKIKIFIEKIFWNFPEKQKNKYNKFLFTYNNKRQQYLLQNNEQE